MLPYLRYLTVLFVLFWHWQWNNQRKHCPLAAYRPTTCGVSLFIYLLTCLMPGSDNFLDADILQPMAAHYKSNTDDFNLELSQMKRMIARKTTDNMDHLTSNSLLNSHQSAYCKHHSTIWISQTVYCYFWALPSISFLFFFCFYTF